MTNSTNTGSGATAQGQGSVAAGERAIAVGGNLINRENVTLNIITADANELMQSLLGLPLKNRREQWINEVGQAVIDLHKHTGITVEELQANDAFVDTVLQASQLALKTSKQEKREALRNAIINSALPSAPDEVLQQMFLNLIDEFSVWHIRVLKLLAGSEEFTEQFIGVSELRIDIDYEKYVRPTNLFDPEGRPVGVRVDKSVSPHELDSVLKKVFTPNEIVQLCYPEITNYVDILMWGLAKNHLYSYDLNNTQAYMLASIIGILGFATDLIDKHKFEAENELRRLFKEQNYLDKLKKYKWTTELGDQFLKFIESPFN